MDADRIALYAKSAIFIGDQGFLLKSTSELSTFMDVLFGKRRLLILKIKSNKKKILKELKTFCMSKEIDFTQLNDQQLTVDFLRGEPEINYADSEGPYYTRLPNYVSNNKQMIVVPHLSRETDLEVLKAFLYMASLGTYFDNIEKLPKDKLPNGSAYVFLADDQFPLNKFYTISPSARAEFAILDLRDFQTRVIEHLGEYRKKMLKVSEKGKFKEREYEHILDKKKEDLNIIEKYRSDFYESDYIKDIQFHKYFHHLNSSQAMCINFFYPLIKEKLLEAFLPIIGVKGAITFNNKNICFEKESKLEGGSQRKTNFDFYIKLESGVNIYFEIKYTEREFGKAKDDDDHKAKFNHTYLPKLKDNLAINSIYKTENMFLKNYQIMRNLMHIDKDSYVVFIYPKENVGIRRAALNARQVIIEKGWESHFILYTWEALAEQLVARIQNKEIVDYYKNDFCYKYLKY